LTWPTRPAKQHCNGSRLLLEAQWRRFGASLMHQTPIIRSWIDAMKHVSTDSHYRAEQTAPVETPSDQPLFKLDQATFRVKGRTLLHPLELRIKRHSLLGLIGHNGSGKSTLLKLLGRQQFLSAGNLQFEGKDLAAWGNREFARKVGYLPQQPPPANGLLVKELVALGRYPWHGPFGQFSDRDVAQVAQAMALTDTTRFADQFVETLSGGERQRAWIAMLLAQETECLLLDEPTASLDIAHQVELLTLVRRLCKERGLTVVIVLHDINMAARVCDDLVALHSGRVLLRGTPAELMSTDRLEAIYGVPLGILAHPKTGAPISYVQ
jgi:ferric hydroxamate transport system ATP-binding protein